MKLLRLCSSQLGLNGLQYQRAFTINRTHSRCQSTTTASANGVASDDLKTPKNNLPPLSRMPTGELLRSFILTSIMSSRLLNPCLWMLGRVSRSKSFLLSPAKNPIVDMALRTTIYKHFCAGSNSDQVTRTVLGMKKMGFAGVILGYAKECVLDLNVSSGAAREAESSAADDKAIKAWKEGTLQTLRMIGPGDFLAIKFTGASPSTVHALSQGRPPPAAVAEAMQTICTETALRGSRLWIDAEQQVLQRTLDEWAIDLMRTHNRDGKALVYNTIQAYLKSASENVDRHLRLAGREGWTLGVKLVRGAYIKHERRELICDTQEKTDASYDLIAESLLTRRFVKETVDDGSGGDSGSGKRSAFPNVQLFLASHNLVSVRKAYNLHSTRIKSGQPTVPMEYGQLQGMADDVSCELLQLGEAAETHTHTHTNDEKNLQAGPRAFKCLTWGSTTECVGFLYRRAIENRGAVVRTRRMADALRGEVWRRVGWGARS